MVGCFDIDGFLCTNNNIFSKNQIPLSISKRIKIVNKLIKKGHNIKLFTSRDSTTIFNWRSLKKFHLLNWGVKYHSLELGKPAATFYIDDKTKSEKESFDFNLDKI